MFKRMIEAWLCVLGLACAMRAEPPQGELPRVDQCRAAYVCEPGTELLQAGDGAVWLDRAWCSNDRFFPLFGRRP